MLAPDRFNEIQISREDFIECIEYGIKSSENLGLNEATKLREVASKATSALTGFYTWEGCGCPAHKAGLLDLEKMVVYREPSVSTFVSCFDKICRRKFGLDRARLLIKG